MRSWKNRWKDELDEITPALRDDVKNIPVFVTENTEDNGGNTAVAIIHRKKIIRIVAAVTALLICAMILCVCLIKQSDAYGDFLFTLEINPTVTMSADGNGIVTGVIASNVDADIILSDENVSNRIKGKNIDDAVTYYTDCAAKLGFIDLEQEGSAVRITGFGNEAFLRKAQMALETYCMDKGAYVVVVAENVDKNEFALRSGISEDLSVEETVKYIKDSTVLFTDREAEKLSLSDLQELYNKIIIADKLFDCVNENLTDNLERIAKNAEDITNLSQLYMDILNHDDNPIKLFGNYWTVKKMYGDTLSGEFAELMLQMETALENYKADYGVEITNITQLTDAVNSYLKIPVNTLTMLSENFSFDIFKELSSDITEILEITGLITTDFANYLRIPQSFADYAEKTTALIGSEYKSRLEKYESVYNKYRKSIEKSDYETYMEGVVQQYGSLNGYWQIVKK